MALLFSACSKPAPTQVTVTRSGCVDCHRPLDGQGMAHGIEACIRRSRASRSPVFAATEGTPPLEA